MQSSLILTTIAGAWAMSVAIGRADDVEDVSLLQHSLEIEQKPQSATVATPDVVILGIGDSGTRGVKSMMNHLGIAMCTTQENPTSDNKLTMPAQVFIPKLLEAANGSYTRDAYMTSGVFDEAVDTERSGAAATHSCILNNMNVRRPSDVGNVKWGYKNPRHIYLMPVMDATFDTKQSMLMVARDPRDICTAHNKGQYNLYAGIVLGEDLDYGLPQCLRFLGSVWASVLRDFEGAENVLIVRIEDLVVPDPKVSNTSLQILQRMMEFAADISPTTEAMQEELEVSHSYNDSYMGYHYGTPAWKRKMWEKETAETASTSEDVHAMMLALGYHPDHYGLVEPMHPLVYSV